MHTIERYKILMLRPTEIHSGIALIRRQFDPHALACLADSVSAGGILDPLCVRRMPSGTYELLAGARRLRAAKMAGLRRVPCIVYRVDDTTAMLYGILDNLHRQALSAEELAAGCRRIVECGSFSKTETALRLGLSPSEFAALLSPEAPPPPAVPKAAPPPAPPKEDPVRKIALADLRFFSNSLYKLADTVRNAGIEVKIQHRETENYLEYKIRLDKSYQKSGAMQLKIC